MKPLLACIGSLLIAGMIVLPGRASPQDHRLSYVPDFVTLTPDGSAGFTVHVEDEAGPMEGAMVEVEFSMTAEELVAWTGDQIHPILTGLTDRKGEIVFFISGGGCFYRLAGPR